MYQDFVVQSGVFALSFELFIGNRADPLFPPTWASPSTLLFDTVLNQQARVDIIRTSANVFSVLPADVIVNVFQTQVGNPLVSGYSTRMFNLGFALSGLVGQTVRVRFAETDNLAPFNFGVDNVSLDTAAVPEPASVLLFGTGLAAVVLRRRRRR
jgi:hypothetical protein